MSLNLFHAASGKLLLLPLLLFPVALFAFVIPLRQDPPCDTIITKTGEMIVGRIKLLTETEIQYSDCAGQKKWNRSVTMSAVKEVRSKSYGKYAKRILARLKKRENDGQPFTGKAKNHGLAVASFIAGIAVFLPPATFAAIPLSLIFGFMALNRIGRSNGRYKGKWMAITGIALGFIGLAGLVILILFLALTL